MDLVLNDGVRKESIGDEVEVRPGVTAVDELLPGVSAPPGQHLTGIGVHCRQQLTVHHSQEEVLPDQNISK